MSARVAVGAAAVAAALLVGCRSGESHPTPAEAGERRFFPVELVNRTGQEIEAVYLSPDRAPGYEQAGLRGPLAPDASTELELEAGRWALRIVLADGDEIAEPGVVVDGPRRLVVRPNGL